MKASLVPYKSATSATFNSGGALRRKCACNDHAGSCETCRRQQSVPSVVADVLRSTGQPLDQITRDFMEPRLGHEFSKVQANSLARSDAQTRLTLSAPHDEFEHEADSIAERVTGMPATFGEDRHDFSNVRIHNDTRAAESARAVNALAYTVGQDVVFGAGQYAPQTLEGSRLIAHELSHVVQQSGLGGSNAIGVGATGALQRQVEDPGNEPSPVSEEQPDTKEEPAELRALSETVEHLAYMVRSATRDQNNPTLPGRTTAGGSTVCNPDTGQPEWQINRNRVPQCMWPCAERHEQTHAEFMRMPCETVWLPFERANFWIRIARQYLQSGNAPEVERAMRESAAAVREAEREVQWYLMYMQQTCRYDEGTAYEAGIEVCDTNEVRRRCTETGELSEYTRQMATWRQFMQNPPNCPAPPSRPNTPTGGR